MPNALPHGYPAASQVIADCTEDIDAAKGAPFADPGVYESRGDGYWNNNDYERAIADYTKAIELAPSDFSIFLKRGFVYEAKGNPSHAEKDYREARRIWIEGLQDA
jgi:tetratricopeptide (TPR) repeat protein